MGILEYLGWHIPGFVIIYPLSEVLNKGKPWEWKLEYKEVIKTLKD